MNDFVDLKQEIIAKRQSGVVHCILEHQGTWSNSFISQQTQIDTINSIIPKYGFPASVFYGLRMRIN